MFFLSRISGVGRKGGWFSAVRRALGSQQREKKDQNSKSKKNVSSENLYSDAVDSPKEVNVGSVPSPPPLSPGVAEEAKPEQCVNIDDVQNQNASGKAAEAAAPHTCPARPVKKSKEELAAIKIQTVFRAYLARRVLQALRRMARLKSLVEGPSVKRQAANTLRCMQTLARVQSQIHARKIRLSEENQALQRQLQRKQERENESLKMVEAFDVSSRSKEQIEENQHKQQEAALRRERALAYAYTHQRKNLKNSNPSFMDPNNPQWGWSWLERWMAARPWEARSDSEKEVCDQGSMKGFRALSLAGEINRTNSLQDHKGDGNKPYPSARKQLNRATTFQPSTVGRPVSIPKPRKVKSGHLERKGLEDSAMSPTALSPQSRSSRRHSIGGAMVRDELARNYTGAAKTAKGKKKLYSPEGNADQRNNGAPELKQQPLGLAKKQLSFSPSSPGARRHSIGGKVDSQPARDTPVEADH